LIDEACDVLLAGGGRVAVEDVVDAVLDQVGAEVLGGLGVAEGGGGVGDEDGNAEKGRHGRSVRIGAGASDLQFVSDWLESVGAAADLWPASRTRARVLFVLVVVLLVVAVLAAL